MEGYSASSYDFANNNGGVHIMDERIKTIADDYLDKLRSVDEYVAYKDELNMLERFPDLMTRVDAYRAENFAIQSRFEGDELYDRVEELQNRYDDILSDGRVSNFLHAESNFCRMIQEVNQYIVEGLDI